MGQRVSPNIRCQFYAEGWGPHEGAKEFMSEPEVFVCKDKATHIVKTDEVTMGIPYGAKVLPAGVERSVTFECVRHAVESEATLTDNYTLRVRAYRFRQD